MKMILAAWIVAVGVQTPAAAPLGESARAHLRADTFAPIAHVAELTAPVQDALRAFFQTKTLTMADPGQPFQSTDVVMDPSLPTRRLIAAGCSSDHCLVHYEQGGFAHSYRVLLVSASKTTAAKVEWNGMSGGPFPNISDVKMLIVDGKIRGSSDRD